MKQRPNLIQLRSSIEKELQSIGAVITKCTESELRFAGGMLVFRPLINLKGGTINFTESNGFSSSARVSLTTIMLPLMAGIVALPFSLAAIFFLPVALAILVATAGIMFMTWAHAVHWLAQLVERAAVQQGTPRDGFAAREF
jgi:hypothetical protein